MFQKFQKDRKKKKNLDVLRKKNLQIWEIFRKYVHQHVYLQHKHTILENIKKKNHKYFQKPCRIEIRNPKLYLYNSDPKRLGKIGNYQNRKKTHFQN